MFLRNDEKKRAYVAAGASAGVSVAFGAPIGGALFAYEMSKPNTFWRFSMIWKVFFACSVANLTLAILTSLYSNEFQGWNVSVLKFGDVVDNYKGTDYWILVPSSLFIGVLGGLYGPLFININFRINAWRKNNIKSKGAKVIEAGFFCFLSASIFYFVPYIMNDCKEQGKNDGEKIRQEAWCPQSDDETIINYNPLATIMWSSEGEIIRNLMRQNFDITIPKLAVFALVWQILTAITYGVNVPAGLFLPGMVIGSATGELLARCMHEFHWIDEGMYGDVRKHFVVLGCSSFLAGYTRMTYSLAVIMMETSQSISIFIPIIFTIIVSN